MYVAAKNINLKCGIFIETDVENQDIETEIKEMMDVCESKESNINYMIIKMDIDRELEDFMNDVDKYKDNKYVVGIRKMLIKNDIFDTKYDDYNQVPQRFRDNLVALSKKEDIKWTFDIAINIEMLEAVELLVKSVPDMIFVLNNMGNHHQICGDEKLNTLWKEVMVKLSKYNNLCVRLSALSGGLPGGECDKWVFDVERDDVEFVIGTFNEDNIMYGSDWPPSIVRFKEDKDSQLFIDYWARSLYCYLKKEKGKEL